MRLMLIQLSDIHLRAANNPVSQRVEAIASAVRNLDPDVRACLLAFTGDIVSTGAPAEYSVALEFIISVQAALTDALPADLPVYTVLIPGNHDCDLSGPQLARDLLRGQFADGSHADVDDSVVDVCTTPQRAFFELRDLLGDGKSLFPIHKLYYEYRIPIDGEVVEVRCLNTSWLTQRHEVEGTLHFPARLIPQRNAGAALCISLLHHPFPWFNTLARRELQRELEQTSDIILTGHEHTESRRQQHVSTGETNQFIEAAALQTTDESESAFNVLLLDTSNRQQRYMTFNWVSDAYLPSREGEWEAFQVNRLRARKDFELREDFAAFLDDPGAGFEKDGVGRPRLSALFVYPELRRISLKKSDVAAPMESDTVLDESTVPNLLISGAEQNGKTCFAKMCFSRLREQGLVPLFLDGRDFSPQRGDRLFEQFYRQFGEEYASEAEQKYRQLEPNRRAIIIDNFHKVRVPPGSTERFLDDLERFAGRVLLFTNDLAHAFGELLRAGDVLEERATFAHYRLIPFGYAKRTELTTRWLTLGGALEDEQLARRLTEAEDRMEVVLGKNFVPAFPIFLLALLQGLERASQTDIGASTYGYFYEILIKATLSRGSTHAQVNVRYTYLTRLAFWLYEGGRTEITEAELREFHDEHLKVYDLDLPFREHVSDLVERLVLWHHGDSYGLKYQYFYYYFVARYISIQLGRDRELGRPLVEELTRGVSEEEGANVLLFLAHLSPDPMIVDEIIAVAQAQFVDSEIAKLEEDVQFLAELTSGAVELEYEDGSFSDNRRALAAHRDRIARESEVVEEQTDDDPELSQEGFDLIQTELNRLGTALKTLQILGQVLKNHPASFTAEEKERIATEAYQLGLRVLGNTLRMAKDGRHELVQHAIATLRAERPDEDAGKILRKANGIVFGLALVSAYGVIKRISAAVGSPELSLTYPRVLRALPFVSTRLANTSIRLDGAQFPRGELLRLAADLRENVLGTSVLRWMVWSHVNLFPVKFRERQEVFEAVGISYRPSIGANPKRRLLGPGRGGP